MAEPHLSQFLLQLVDLLLCLHRLQSLCRTLSLSLSLSLSTFETYKTSRTSTHLVRSEIVHRVPDPGRTLAVREDLEIHRHLHKTSEQNLDY